MATSSYWQCAPKAELNKDRYIIHWVVTVQGHTTNTKQPSKNKNTNKTNTTQKQHGRWPAGQFMVIWNSTPHSALRVFSMIPCRSLGMTCRFMALKCSLLDLKVKRLSHLQPSGSLPLPRLSRAVWKPIQISTHTHPPINYQCLTRISVTKQPQYWTKKSLSGSKPCFFSVRRLLAFARSFNTFDCMLQRWVN